MLFFSWSAWKSVAEQHEELGDVYNFMPLGVHLENFSQSILGDKKRCSQERLIDLEIQATMDSCGLFVVMIPV